MTTFPRKVKTFIPWTKAMIAGATLDKPDYPGTSGTSQRRKKRRRKKKRKKYAKAL